jgi:histidyl-tRNA synthetase
MATKPRESLTQVVVASIDFDYIIERLKLAGDLWKAGIVTEFSYKKN